MKEGIGEVVWDDLTRELDAWLAEGLTATFWWRDDDAIEVTDALERMLKISENTGTPIAMAVIPARAGNDLRDRLIRHKRVDVLQHGLAHANHEAEGGKKSEFGASRDIKLVEAELRQGRDILSGWTSFLPVFVPPWNRMDSRILDVLPRLGIRGVSSFKARQARCPVPGLLGVNTHVDIIKSSDGGRYFIGVGPAIQAIIDHLSSRRLGNVDRDEPSGILTHHLDHSGESWTFLERLLRLVGNHPAGRWLSAREIFNVEAV